MTERMGRNLEMRHLRAVMATAETGSLHRAAAALGTSQPALSRLLREAEQRLGVSLFQRTARGSLATPAGVWVEQVARRVHADLERLAELAAAPAWRLRIGCIPRAIDDVMPRLLHLPPPLRDRIRIELHEGDSPALIALMARGELDIGVLSPVAAAGPAVLSRLLYLDRNVFVCGRPAPLPTGTRLSPRELARHPFVAPAPGSPSRLEFDQYWRQHAVPPRSGYEPGYVAPPQHKW